MSLASGNDLSDDEIFIGKLTMTEVKKHIFSGRARCANSDFHDELNSSINTFDIEKEDQNTILKIIEVHSQPNLNSPCVDHRTSDASFLEMEEFVNKLCLSPQKINSKDDLTYKKVLGNINKEDIIKLETKQKSQSPIVDSIQNIHSNVLQEQNVKLHESNNIAYVTASVTPIKRNNQFTDKDVFKTPLTSIKSKPTVKTSSNTPHSSKKTCVTPMKKSNTPKYQDIMSPVAAYIHQSPQTPLVQNVHHKKTLTGLSLIPQLGRNYIKPANKENIKLPLIAYRSAKVTKLIDLPEDKKIPKSCTQTLSSIPRPTIIKHTHREIGPKPMTTNIEDSFANLSYHQAEISVCTQKLAYNTKK
ncbi:hypothetical protein K1T71_001947 [Dendrolimus kikuchii]|uniref:Uncharacterized protein n=1 Tax=Dendrolimus kikuchii TaxID=765133 RepID=A0ACC1DFY1_9NEOP|nr:hypothetical protein K1T71_001947 [Dendrolimus kikuchii]